MLTGNSHPESPPYVYEALPAGSWFRLLRLEPGPRHTPLRCKLVDENLQNLPVYEAISYVWGSPSGSIPLDCDGHLLLITPSLNDALHCIRHETLEKTVWADAVCINQRSTTEKSHQVNQMALVYQQASKVLIWLGQDHERDAHQAFEFMTEVNEHFEQGIERYGRVDDVPVLPLDHSFLDVARWYPLQRLFSQPWFSRVWIIQEVGLAATAVVLYGEQSILWSQIVQFVLIEYRRSDLSAVPVTLRIGRTIDAFNLLWCTYANTTSWRTERPYIRYLSGLPHHKHRNNFFNVLLTGARFDSTDARDHVYAFLGHPSARKPDKQGTFLEADYQISREELYCLVATQMLDQMSSLVVLSAVEQSLRMPTSTLPTWVPCWDQGCTSIMLTPFPGQENFYDASLRSETSQEYVAATSRDVSQKRNPTLGMRLHVRGFRLAVVEAMSEVMTREAYDQSSGLDEDCDLFINPIESALLLAKSLQSPRQSDSDLLQAFCLTIAAGFDKLRRAASQNMEKHISNFASFCRSKFSSRLNTELEQCSIMQQTVDGDGRNFSAQARQFCHGRRFFVTDDGLFGLGPTAMEKDDICCVLIGARVPFLLRRAANSELYKVVGECYLHGYMEGKAIHDWRKGALTVEDVVLS